MRIEETKITPALAREWLGVDPDRHIRPLKARNLQRLRAAIENGDWQLTHQPIALAHNGFVLDGRHRLTAIAGQRKTLRALVAFDVSDDTYKVIDIGTTRTPGDSLAVAGYTNTATLAAAARQIIGYPTIVGTADNLQNATAGVTPTMITDFVDNSVDGKILADILRPSMRIADQIGQLGLRTTFPVLQTLLQIRSEYGPDAREEYMIRLADGANLDTSSPILGLRRWLMGGAYQNVTRNWRSTAALHLCIRTWNAYVRDEQRGPLVFRPGISTMPEIR